MAKTTFTEKNAGLSFQLKAINEEIKSEIDKSGMMIVRNVPCTILNERNANGRSYSTSTMKSALNENSKAGMYEARTLTCTADDHPDTTYPKPINSSHVVIGTNIVNENGQDVLLNDWLILPTDSGRNLRALIESGVSVGTSIRGLGRQDESTGAIEDYEYLGTDVVGNPSAGTYANFKGLNESIIVEAASSVLVESVKESLSDDNNKSNLNEDNHKMFVLEEAIEAFKQKHKEGDVSSDMVSDLLQIEMKVLEHHADTKVFQAFKNSILGAIPKKEESSKDEKDLKAEEAKDEDAINKAQRHLEASEIVAFQLKEQNEQLLEEVKSLRKYKESSAKLVNELTNRVKTALEDVKQRESSIEESEEKLVQSMKQAAVEMADDLQAEAKEAILQLETRLEQTIQMGDIVAKYFFASKSINESLVERIKKQQQVKEEEIKSISENVMSKQKSKREPSRPGWK